MSAVLICFQCSEKKLCKLIYSGSPQSKFLKSLCNTQHDDGYRQVVYCIPRVTVDSVPLGYEAPRLGKLPLVFLQNITHHLSSDAASHPKKNGILNHTAAGTSKLNSVTLISTRIMNNEQVKFRTRSTVKCFLKHCPTFESLYKNKSLKPYKFHRVLTRKCKITL